MGIKFAVPLWLRWLIAFGLLGFVGPMIEGASFGDLGYTLVSWLLFVWLVLFPGQRVGFPRMFGVAILVWIVLIPVLILLFVNGEAGGDFVSEYPRRTQPDLLRLMFLPYLVLFPALVVTLSRRLAAFRPLVVVLLLCDVLASVLWCARWHVDITATGRWTLALDLLLEVAVVAYLLLHFRPRDASAGQTAAGSTSVRATAR